MSGNSTWETYITNHHVYEQWHLDIERRLASGIPIDPSARQALATLDILRKIDSFTPITYEVAGTLDVRAVGDGLSLLQIDAKVEDGKIINVGDVVRTIHYVLEFAQPHYFSGEDNHMSHRRGSSGLKREIAALDNYSPRLPHNVSVVRNLCDINAAFCVGIDSAVKQELNKEFEAKGLRTIYNSAPLIKDSIMTFMTGILIQAGYL